MVVRHRWGDWPLGGSIFLHPVGGGRVPGRKYCPEVQAMSQQQGCQLWFKEIEVKAITFCDKASICIRVPRLVTQGNSALFQWQTDYKVG